MVPTRRVTVTRRDVATCPSRMLLRVRHEWAQNTLRTRSGSWARMIDLIFQFKLLSESQCAKMQAVGGEHRSQVPTIKQNSLKTSEINGAKQLPDSELNRNVQSL